MATTKQTEHAPATNPEPKAAASAGPITAPELVTTEASPGRYGMRRVSNPLLFFVVFAFIGVASLILTHAATSAGPIYSKVAGNKCIDNADQKTTDRNKIQLWDCDGTVAQQWTATSAGTIVNQNGYCLDVRHSGTASKTIVQLYHCNGTGAQQWTINKTTGAVVNPHSNLCLDDKYASAANGNQIWVYTCNGTNAQKWTFSSAATPSPTPAPKPTPTPTPTPKPTPTPTPTGNNPSGQAMPVGSISGWKQLFADDFTGTVPVGAFSDCNHSINTPQAYCGGLKNYASYYKNWWAYPSGWDDTSEECIKHENGCPDTSLKIPIGGVYSPEKAVSVSSGAMHIHMYRPSSGPNVVASMVPRACMAHQYGRYVERFKVVQANPGFKSAHLFYDGGYEMDYPENDYGSSISAYTHPGEQNFDTSAKWTTWHTTAIEWTASSIKYYMDGKLVGTATKSIPHIKMDWVLQNESSIMGPYAKTGASAQLDLDWVTCYAPA